jgi:trimethylamine:corrinoid methyltransferase-like protein
MRGEFFNPALANRDKREMLGDGEDALSRARKTVKRILASTAESLLPRDIDRELRAAFPQIRSVSD